MGRSVRGAEANNYNHKLYSKGYARPFHRKERTTTGPSYAPTSNGRRVQWDRDFRGAYGDQGEWQ